MAISQGIYDPKPKVKVNGIKENRKEYILYDYMGCSINK